MFVSLFAWLFFGILKIKKFMILNISVVTFIVHFHNTFKPIEPELNVIRLNWAEQLRRCQEL